ncbi:MAG: Uma2 family endonuclease [Rhodomicrobium sp.]
MPNRAFKFETMSADDFEELILDMPADEKWELIGGRVVRGMVGARWEHHRLVQNISFALMQHFRATSSTCRPYNETFWLKEKLLELQVFPDVMVRCGPLEPGAVHLSDPVAVVEVLSPGTEARDRHEKWGLYQKLDSVKHYVLVARGKAHVEVFSRGEGEWSGFQVLEGLEATLKLPAIDFEMPLADIYRDVLGEERAAS